MFLCLQRWISNRGGIDDPNRGCGSLVYEKNQSNPSQWLWFSGVVRLWFSRGFQATRFRFGRKAIKDEMRWNVSSLSRSPTMTVCNMLSVNQNRIMRNNITLKRELNSPTHEISIWLHLYTQISRCGVEKKRAKKKDKHAKWNLKHKLHEYIERVQELADEYYHTVVSRLSRSMYPILLGIVVVVTGDTSYLEHPRNTRKRAESWWQCLCCTKRGGKGTRDGGWGTTGALDGCFGCFGWGTMDGLDGKTTAA